MTPRRFKYSRMPTYPSLEPGLPIIPFTLTYQGQTCTVQASIDSGSSINVLPYEGRFTIRVDLGKSDLCVTSSTLAAQFSGFWRLIDRPARSFSSCEISLCLDSKNQCGNPDHPGRNQFFQEFDVCFSGSQQFFEIAPKGDLLQTA